VPSHAFGVPVQLKYVLDKPRLFAWWYANLLAARCALLYGDLVKGARSGFLLLIPIFPSPTRLLSKIGLPFAHLLSAAKDSAVRMAACRIGERAQKVASFSDATVHFGPPLRLVETPRAFRVEAGAKDILSNPKESYRFYMAMKHSWVCLVLNFDRFSLTM